jgi:hypothetical protein
MQTSGAMAPNGEAEVEKKLTIVFRTFLGYLTGIYVDPKNKNQRIGPYLATHVLFIYLFPFFSEKSDGFQIITTHLTRKKKRYTRHFFVVKKN